MGHMPSHCSPSASASSPTTSALSIYLSIYLSIHSQTYRALWMLSPSAWGVPLSPGRGRMSVWLAAWHIAILLPASSRIPMTMRYRPFQVCGQHTLVSGHS